MEKEKTCKIVFSDIDGTLLTSDGQITEGTKEMILNLENKGIPFILTSARSPEGVRVIKRMLGNHAPIIAFCGGLILDDDGNEIYSKMIPLKRALELKAMLDKDFPAVACNTFGGEKWIVDDRDDWREQREEKIVGFPAEIGAIKDIFEKEGGIHKFLLMGDPDVMTKLAAVLARDFSDLQSAASNPEYLEITAAGVEKLEGLKTLCGKLGISPEEAAAFGDGESDLSMMRAAGFGVAMGNAPENVRRRAPMVIGKNDEEGLLKRLKEIFKD